MQRASLKGGQAAPTPRVLRQATALKPLQDRNFLRVGVELISELQRR